MSSVRLYAAVAAGGFRRYATYRVATAAGVFTNTVFGVILVSVYLALWDVKPHLGGYGPAQAVTYVWLGQALLTPLAIGGGGFEDEFVERVRSGDVAVDLYRPADLQLWWLANDFGRGMYQLVGRGVVPFIFGALFFRVALPTAVLTWVGFAVTVLLAMLVGFAIRYLVALAAFWLLDGTGAVQTARFTGMFFSGMVLPLNVFPGALGDVARVLPWAALLQAPADVLVGHAPVSATIAFQAAWACVLLVLGRAVQSAATRRVVVQGG